MKTSWSCKIGEMGPSKVPAGDLPMRMAVQRAYEQLTGEAPAFCFSGWGAQLTDGERAVVEDRLQTQPVCQQHAETIRSLKAEVAEWKRRFELLLGSKEKRVGTLSIGPTPGEAEDMP